MARPSSIEGVYPLTRIDDVGGDPGRSVGPVGYHSVDDADSAWLNHHMDRIANAYRRVIGYDPHPIPLGEFASLRAPIETVMSMMNSGRQMIVDQFHQGDKPHPDFHPVSYASYSGIAQGGAALWGGLMNISQNVREMFTGTQEQQRTREIAAAIEKADPRVQQLQSEQDSQGQIDPRTGEKVGASGRSADIQKQRDDIKRATEWLQAQYDVKSVNDIKGVLTEFGFKPSTGKDFNENDVRNTRFLFQQMAQQTRGAQESIQQRGYGNGLTANGIVTENWRSAFTEFQRDEEQKLAAKKTLPILAPYIDETGLPNQWMRQMQRDLDPRYGGLPPLNLLKGGWDVINGMLNVPFVFAKRLGNSAAQLEDDPQYNDLIERFYAEAGMDDMIKFRHGTLGYHALPGLQSSVAKGWDAMMGAWFGQLGRNPQAQLTPQAQQLLDQVRARRDEVLVNAGQQPWLYSMGADPEWLADPKNAHLILAADVGVDLLIGSKLGTMMKVGKIEGLASTEAYAKNGPFNRLMSAVRNDIVGGNASLAGIRMGDSIYSNRLVAELNQMWHDSVVSDIVSEQRTAFRKRMALLEDRSGSTNLDRMVASGEDQSKLPQAARRADQTAADTGAPSPSGDVALADKTEPWQMRKSEYLKNFKADRTDAETVAEHRQHVRNAVKQGKDVPDSVLGDHLGTDGSFFERYSISRGARGMGVPEKGVGETIGTRAGVAAGAEVGGGAAAGEVRPYVVGRGSLTQQEVFDHVVKSFKDRGFWQGVKAYQTAGAIVRAFAYRSQEHGWFGRLFATGANRFLPLVYGSLRVAPSGMTRLFYQDHKFVNDIRAAVASITRNPRMTESFAQRAMAALKTNESGRVVLDLPKAQNLLQDTKALVERYWRGDISRNEAIGRNPTNMFGADASRPVVNSQPMHLMDLPGKDYWPTTEGLYLRNDVESVSRRFFGINDATIENSIINLNETFAGWTRDIRLLNVWFNIGWSARLLASSALRMAAEGLVLPESHGFGKSLSGAFEKGAAEGSFWQGVGRFIDMKFPGGKERDFERLMNGLVTDDPIAYHYHQLLDLQARHPYSGEIAKQDISGTAGADVPAVMAAAMDKQQTGGALARATFTRLRDDHLSKAYRSGMKSSTALTRRRGAIASELESLRGVEEKQQDARRIAALEEEMGGIDSALTDFGTNRASQRLGARYSLSEFLNSPRGEAFLYSRMEPAAQQAANLRKRNRASALGKAAGVTKTDRVGAIGVELDSWDYSLAKEKEKFLKDFADYHDSYYDHAPQTMSAVEAGASDEAVTAALDKDIASGHNPYVRGVVPSETIDPHVAQDLKKALGQMVGTSAATGTPPMIAFGDPADRPKLMANVERFGFTGIALRSDYWQKVPGLGQLMKHFHVDGIPVGAAHPMGWTRQAVNERIRAKMFFDLKEANPGLSNIQLLDMAHRTSYQMTDHLMLNIGQMWNYEKQFRGIVFYATKRRLYETLMMELAVKYPGKYRGFEDVANYVAQKNDAEGKPSYRAYEVCFGDRCFQMDQSLWLGQSTYLSNPAQIIAYLTQQATGIQGESAFKPRFPELTAFDGIAASFLHAGSFAAQGRSGLEDRLGIPEFKAIDQSDPALAKEWRADHPEAAAYMRSVNAEIMKAQASGKWPTEPAQQKAAIDGFAKAYMVDRFLGEGFRSFLRVPGKVATPDEISLRGKLLQYDGLLDAQDRLKFLQNNPEVGAFFRVYNDPDSYAQINGASQALTELRKVRDQAKDAFLSKPPAYQREHIGELFKSDGDYAQGVDDLKTKYPVWAQSFDGTLGEHIVKDRTTFRDQAEQVFPNIAKGELDRLIPPPEVQAVLDAKKNIQTLRDMAKGKSLDYFNTDPNAAKQFSQTLGFLSSVEDSFNTEQFFTPPADPREAQLRRFLTERVYDYYAKTGPIYEELFSSPGPNSARRAKLQTMLKKLQDEADKPQTFEGEQFPPVEQAIWGMWDTDRQTEKMREWVYRWTQGSQTLTKFQRSKVNALRSSDHDAYLKLLTEARQKAKTGGYGQP